MNINLAALSLGGGSLGNENVDEFKGSLFVAFTGEALCGLGLTACERQLLGFFLEKMFSGEGVFDFEESPEGGVVVIGLGLQQL